MNTRDILIDYVYPRSAVLARYGLVVDEETMSTASGSSFYYDALETLENSKYLIFKIVANLNVLILNLYSASYSDKIIRFSDRTLKLILNCRIIAVLVK